MSNQTTILNSGAKFHDDCRLVAMAVRKRWPISDEVKERLVERLAHAALENADDEVAIKAATVLRSMEQQNQKDEQADIIHTDRNRFLEIAQRLGIDKSFRGASEIRAGDRITIIDGETA